MSGRRTNPTSGQENATACRLDLPGTRSATERSTSGRSSPCRAIFACSVERIDRPQSGPDIDASRLVRILDDAAGLPVLDLHLPRERSALQIVGQHVAVIGPRILPRSPGTCCSNRFRFWAYDWTIFLSGSATECFAVSTETPASSNGSTTSRRRPARTASTTELTTGSVYGFACDTCRVIWRRPCGPGVFTDLACSGERVFVHTLQDSVLCLDRSTGRTLWAYAAPGTGDSTSKEPLSQKLKSHLRRDSGRLGVALPGCEGGRAGVLPAWACGCDHYAHA